MKKTSLILGTMALFGALSLAGLARGQDTATNAPAPSPAPLATEPAAPTPPRSFPLPQGPRPGMPQYRRQMAYPAFRQAINGLRRARMELQNSPGDFAGHRQSAMDACDKAIEELNAIVHAPNPAIHPLTPQPMAPNVPVAPAPTPPQ